MAAFTNISAYKFTPLADLKPLRERLIALCKGLGLKGTILLSTEGINLFVAGQPGSVEALVTELRTIPGLEDIEDEVLCPAAQELGIRGRGHFALCGNLNQTREPRIIKWRHCPKCKNA